MPNPNINQLSIIPLSPIGNTSINHPKTMQTNAAHILKGLQRMNALNM